MRLFDANKRHRLDLVTQADFVVCLGMKNADQQPRIGLSLTGKEQTSSMLEFRDNDSKPRVQIGVSMDGEPYLNFLDPEGEVVAAYP